MPTVSPGLIAELLGDSSVDVEAIIDRYDLERERRMVERRGEPRVEVTGDFSHYVDDPYTPEIAPRESVRDRVEVLIIGAGHSGILTAVRLREAGVESIRIIDRAGDFGGVWYWNRYPGIQCDVESYTYMPLLEETGYVPSRRYASGQEIFEHAQRIARKWHLYDDALLQTGISDIAWSSATQHWCVKTDRGDDFEARFVVMANGNLSKPKLPGIPGINSFRGHTFHTSRWDYDYTGGSPENPVLDRLKDKRVGIIGTGATAIQVVPQVGRAAERLYVFQRTPSVVGVRGNRDTDREWFSTLQPGWQRDRMVNFTGVTTGVESEVDLIQDGWTELQMALSATAVKRATERIGRTLTDDEKSAALLASDIVAAEQLRDRVEAIVKDPKAAEKLKAWYYLYCKRPTFHDEYLDTFNLPGVTVVDTHGAGVQALTETGVVVDDVEYELDCLIFASGFDVVASHRTLAGYDPVGRDGLRLSQKWSEGLRTMFGNQTRGFPNMFFTGMIQNGAVLNYTHLLDEQARHIAYLVGEAHVRGLGVLEPSFEGEQGWVDEMGRYITQKEYDRWAQCTPGYNNSDGNLQNPTGFLGRRYGGGALRFFSILQSWRDQGDLAGLEVAERIDAGDLAAIDGRRP